MKRLGVGGARRRHPAGRARRPHGAFFLPAAISTAHAGLAEIFFCSTVAIALFTSPRLDRAANDRRSTIGRLRRVATATTALIYLQILVGATMRHTGAGLAIPDFP